jgi:hypothetical protein
MYTAVNRIQNLRKRQPATSRTDGRFSTAVETTSKPLMKSSDLPFPCSKSLTRLSVTEYPGEQIFDRETGDVNPDVSYLTANCDGSLLNLPCCTANGVCAVPHPEFDGRSATITSFVAR